MKRTILFFVLALFGLSMNGQVNLNDGLVAYYPFNGNANDESGNGHNGTVNGATLVSDRFGIANSAYSFNGFDNRIILDNTRSIDGNSGISLVAWVVTNNPGGSSIVSKHLNYTSSGFNLAGTSNQAHFWPYTSPPVSSGTSYDDGKWHLYIGTFDGSIAKIYVDGILKNSETISSLETNLEFIKIGSDSEMSFFNGFIDDVRIYNRVINVDEINAIYNKTTGGKAITDLKKSTISLFPNPTTSHIQLKGIDGKVKLSLFSIDAKLLLTKEFAENETISICTLPKGIYMVRINTKEGIIEKILIKK